jgi:hypothetical protein
MSHHALKCLKTRSPLLRGGVYGVIILGRLTGLKPVDSVSKLLRQSHFGFQIQSVAFNQILDAEMDVSLDEGFEGGLGMFTTRRGFQGS